MVKQVNLIRDIGCPFQPTFFFHSCIFSLLPVLVFKMVRLMEIFQIIWMLQRIHIQSLSPRSVPSDCDQLPCYMVYVLVLIVEVVVVTLVLALLVLEAWKSALERNHHFHRQRMSPIPSCWCSASEYVHEHIYWIETVWKQNLWCNVFLRHSGTQGHADQSNGAKWNQRDFRFQVAAYTFIFARAYALVSCQVD